MIHWFESKHCPYNISSYTGTASANEWHTNLYFSLVDLRNKYYNSWMGWKRGIKHCALLELILPKENEENSINMHKERKMKLWWI